MTNIQQLQEEFEELREEQPLMGDYSLLAEVVEGENLNQDEINALFNQANPEGTYLQDRKALLKDLYTHSQGGE